MIEIVPAFEKNHSLLTAITFDGKAFWGFSKDQLSQWTEILTVTPEYISTNFVFNLTLNSEIIGYYSYLVINEKEIELDNLFLFRKYIGKGYGKLMMIDFLSKAKELNVEYISLIAEPNAENFYKKFGFETFDQLESIIKGRLLPKMKLNL